MNQGDWGTRLAAVPRSTPVQVIQNGASESGGLSYRRTFGWIRYPDEQPDEQYRDDPNDAESPLMERPASWWSASYRGFEAKILINPKGGEDRIERLNFRSSILGKVTEEEYLAIIAERVIAWKYREIMEDGTRVDIDPPVVGGWERFYDLPTPLLQWLIKEIREAHLPKAMTRGGRPVGTLDSTPDPTPKQAAPLDPALDPLES